MYYVGKLLNNQFLAISVPPPTNKSLHPDFQELSRIHFYLGSHSIDHMIEAVEKASPQEIEKGKIPIYFACKEIQDFLSKNSSSINLVFEKFNDSFYFDKSFQDILNETHSQIKKLFSSPKNKSKAKKVETLISLTNEVIFLNEQLNTLGIKTSDISNQISDIKQEYEKVYLLKNTYDSLSNLKTFDSYFDEAKQSVINQLTEPYNFNYGKLARIYEPHDGDWIYTLQMLLEAQKDIDNKDYVFHENDSIELKKEFLEQIKGFNRLLKNGVVNYIYSSSAKISYEQHYLLEKYKKSPEQFFQSKCVYHSQPKRKNDSYHIKELKELHENKDQIIEDYKISLKKKEEISKTLYSQEKFILNTLNQVKNNILGIEFENKNLITFTGDLNKDYIVGFIDDKACLIYNDTTLSHYGAIALSIIDKNTYNDLLKNNQLKFDSAFKNKFNGANFHSYSQFLQEINNSFVQKELFGKEVEIIDKTSKQPQSTKKSKLNHF